MIIDWLLAPIWYFLGFLVDLLPDMNFSSTRGVTSDFIKLLALGFNFVGVKNFVLVISSVLFWSNIHIVWGVIEWVYKKIPGVE